MNDKPLVGMTHIQVQALRSAWNSLTDKKIRVVSQQFYATHYAPVSDIRDNEKLKGIPILSIKDSSKLEASLNFETCWFTETLLMLECYETVACLEEDVQLFERNKRLRGSRLANEQTSEDKFKRGGKLPVYNLAYYQKKITCLKKSKLEDLTCKYQYVLIHMFKAGTLTEKMVSVIFTTNEEELK